MVKWCFVVPFMLTIVCAESHKLAYYAMLIAIMLSVEILSAIMLSVIMVSVVERECLPNHYFTTLIIKLQL